MTSGKSLGVLTALVALAALGACDTIKRLPGLGGDNTAGNQSLDVVDNSVKRPPLTLPPDFNLRPPSSTTANITDLTAAQQARQTVFGLDQEKAPATADLPQKAGRTAGEAALLQHAGAEDVSSGIRTKVNRETETIARQEKVFVDNLMKPPADPKQTQNDGGWLSSIFSTDKKPTMERKSDSGLFGNLF
jgi:hypothetical protein